MNPKIEALIDEIEAMKKRLSDEIDEHEKNISYEIHNGYVRFEQDVLEKQKEEMKHLWMYLKEVPLIHFVVAPLIYAMVIPAVILDLALFVYQKIVFRVFKFQSIKRSDYMVYDRHFLQYLNPIEKLNCVYCSYFNGLMHYAAAIAGRTELYFCPIKHAKKIAYTHEHYPKYFAYGDGQKYQERLEVLRQNSEVIPQA